MKRPRRLLLLLLLLLLGHFAGVVGLIGIDAVVGDSPVVQYDLGLHYYRAALLRETGGFPGLVWDPGYMAGYPVGGTTDIDNRLGELLVVLLSFVPVGAAWNIALIVLYGCVPLLVWLGARWSGSGQEGQVMSLALAILLFWGMTGAPHGFVKWGMYGWVIFSAALPLQFGALQLLLEKPDVRSVLALWFATAFAAYAHGLAAVYLPVLALVVLGRLKQIRVRHLAALGASAVLTAVLVWPIARPVLATLGDVEGTSGLERHFQAEVWEVVDLVGSANRALPNALLLLCAVGIATRLLDRTRLEQAVTAAVIVLVSLFGFMLLPPTGFQPTRNVQPALFLAALPASSVLVAAWTQLSSQRRSVRWAIVGLALALVSPIGVRWGLTAIGKSPLAAAPSAEASALLDYLRSTTTVEARVLMEDDGDHFGGNHFGPTHLVGYLAREIDRQLIGGPYPVTAVRGGSVTFVNGRILDRAVDEFLDLELEEFFRSYNIGTIVVWSEASRERFVRLGLQAHDLEGGYTVFRTGLAGGFAEGADSVSATAVPNEIRVTGATSSPTLLRWQWDPRMRTEPPLPLQALQSPYTPAGFILVDNGSEREFVVRFKG